MSVTYELPHVRLSALVKVRDNGQLCTAVIIHSAGTSKCGVAGRGFAP